jgi:hypothetical protein
MLAPSNAKLNRILMIVVVCVGDVRCPKLRQGAVTLYDGRTPNLKDKVIISRLSPARHTSTV